MTTISKPKCQRTPEADAFRKAMVEIGARWNNTYSYWMVDDDRAEDANAIRAKFPDNPEPERINGATLQFAPKGS